jgi:hypothetical protein
MPSKNKPTLQQRNALMIGRPCTAPGCERPRASVNLYCNKHLHPTLIYGHPLGRSILRKTYARETAEITSLFEANPDHPGMTSVLRWINEWMTQAVAGEAPCGTGIFAHMSRRQLSAMSILIEICSVWLFSHRNPTLLPDDQRLTFALARNPVRLCGFENTTLRSGQTQTKQPKAVELRESGQRIRTTLALFFINVIESLKRRDEQAQAVRSSLSIPFN